MLLGAWGLGLISGTTALLACLIETLVMGGFVFLWPSNPALKASEERRMLSEG